jgi:dTDP-4-amino-4,6-dideoxygalactose transaminase
VVSTAATARKRRENYRWLTERLKNVAGITIIKNVVGITIPYPEIGDAVPRDFPIRVHHGLREKLYWALISEGLPTIALYNRMIDVIAQGEFPISHLLSRSVLNLPVHQDTNIADLRFLTDALTAVLERLGREAPSVRSATKYGAA